MGRAENLFWNVVGGFVYQALTSSVVAVIVSTVLDGIIHLPPAWAGALAALVGIGVFTGLRTLVSRHTGGPRAAVPRAEPQPTPAPTIRQEVRKPFEKQTVVLDGVRFSGCAFRNCTLLWLGGPWGGWDNKCTFDDCRYQTASPVAIQAIDQLKGLGLLIPEFAASWGPEEVRVVLASTPDGR